MKNIGLVIAVFSLLLYGGNVESGYSDYMRTVREESARAARDSLVMEFNEVPELEYGPETWDPATLVKSHTGELEIKSEPVDQMHPGVTILEYKLTDHDSFDQEVSRIFFRTVKVSDTTAPQIKIKKNEVSVIIGNSYDLKENVEKVSDPVDGDLAYAKELTEGTYVVQGSVNVNSIGTYNARVIARDVNGNETSQDFKVSVSYGVYYGNWTGQRLTPTLGTINGPSGKETYYNLPMGGVIAIMRAMGNTDEYWVREDGCKMLGPYIMVAAHLGLRPRGSLVETSLGMGLVCDTGLFALTNPYQIDIAVDW